MHSWGYGKWSYSDGLEEQQTVHLLKPEAQVFIPASVRKTQLNVYAPCFIPGVQFCTPQALVESVQGVGSYSVAGQCRGSAGEGLFMGKGASVPRMVGNILQVDECSISVSEVLDRVDHQAVHGEEMSLHRVNVRCCQQTVVKHGLKDNNGNNLGQYNASVHMSQLSSFKSRHSNND